MERPLKRLVLIADDDHDVRHVIKEYLEAEGFDVMEASNGIEALVQVARVRPGSVVLDLMMPRLGGLEALRSSLLAGGTKVIVITGVDEPELRREALARGASAFFTKPLDLQQLAVAVRAADSAADSQRPVRRSRRAQVLIVDDDVGVRDLLAEFVATKGYEASTASDGAAALKMILARPPDVVLLDIKMPTLEGVPALKSIRAVAPHTKVIMVSGISDVAEAKLTLAYGAFDYVAKPIDFQYLSQSLETALAGEASAG